MYLLEFCCPLLCLLIIRAGTAIVEHYHGKLKIPKLPATFWVICAVVTGLGCSMYSGWVTTITGDELWPVKLVLIVTTITLMFVNIFIILSLSGMFKKPLLLAIQLIVIFIAVPTLWAMFEEKSILLVTFIQVLLVALSGACDLSK